MSAPLRVAVVGAGPAGCYVADALCFDRDRDVTVDLFDQLPTPFGLLRYGVAPDHLKMKSLQVGLERILDDPRVRFYGNVTVGADIAVREFRSAYHAVVYAHGAPVDKHLGIPGEDLRGSHSAADLVSWYSGHPYSATDGHSLQQRAVAVIGLGNVAIDVARILLKDIELLRHTDIPTDVLAALAASEVRDVHLVGRRGIWQAKWTSKELRELGELPDLDILVDDAALEAAGPTTDEANPDLQRCVKVLRNWAEGRRCGAKRRLHLHFDAVPTALIGEDTVTGIHLRRAHGTDELDVQAVFRAVGYAGKPLAGLPFDHHNGVVPTQGSRVDRGAGGEPGEYACGWIRRGARGVLGTNRSDADDCVAAILADHETLVSREIRCDAVASRLYERSLTVVDTAGWKLIDDTEREWGRVEGRPRAKIPTLDQLLAAARGEG